MLDYNDLFKMMREFEFDYINRFGEIIIDSRTNTYSNFDHTKDFEDVKWRCVFNLCRPIGKGLDIKDSKRLMDKFNKYFGTSLKREDFLVMYTEFCYMRKEVEFKDFIKRGFPMEELKND